MMFSTNKSEKISVDSPHPRRQDSRLTPRPRQGAAAPSDSYLEQGRLACTVSVTGVAWEILATPPRLHTPAARQLIGIIRTTALSGAPEASTRVMLTFRRDCGGSPGGGKSRGVQDSCQCPAGPRTCLTCLPAPVPTALPSWKTYAPPGPPQLAYWIFLFLASPLTAWVLRAVGAAQTRCLRNRFRRQCWRHKSSLNRLERAAP